MDWRNSTAGSSGSMWIELMMLEVIAIAAGILIIIFLKMWTDRKKEPTEDNSRPSPVTNITVEIKEQ